MEYKDYRVITVHEKVYYEWEAGIFKKRKKTGTFEYKPVWVVAKSYEKAKEIFSKKYKTTELGKCNTYRYIDKEDGFGFYSVKNPEVIKTELICKTINPSIQEMQSRLGFNEFMKIFTYYRHEYEELFKEA